MFIELLTGDNGLEDSGVGIDKLAVFAEFGSNLCVKVGNLRGGGEGERVVVV